MRGVARGKRRTRGGEEAVERKKNSFLLPHPRRRLRNLLTTKSPQSSSAPGERHLLKLLFSLFSLFSLFFSLLSSLSSVRASVTRKEKEKKEKTDKAGKKRERERESVVVAMVGSNATRTCRAQVFSGRLQHFKRRPRAWSRPASQLAASKQGKQGGQGSIHFQVKVNASPSAPTQQAQASGYTVLFEDVIRQTQLGIALYDITEDVEKVLAKSQVKEGCVNVISRHTTTALTINELEPRLVEDVRQFLQKLVPPSYPYLVSAAISFCFFSLLLSLSLFLSLSLSLCLSLCLSVQQLCLCHLKTDCFLFSPFFLPFLVLHLFL